jgi:hypothetical protein
MSSALAVARSAILLYAAVLATLFALLVPPYEAPDEPSHLAYVNFVATRAGLPNQYDPQRALPQLGPSPPEGHQPPLYYALGALLLRLTSTGPCLEAPPQPNPLHAWNGAGGTRTDVPLFLPPAFPAAPGPLDPEGAAAGESAPEVSIRPTRDVPCLLLLRLFSVLLGVLTVGAVLLLSRRFLAGWWQLLPALLVATLPQFLFASGVVNNDALANLLLTLVLWGAVWALDEPHRWGPYLLLGVALGLVLLTKKTALFVLPVLALLLASVAFRQRPRPASRLVSPPPRPPRPVRVLALGAGALALAFLLSGWLFARNQALYGDPLATEMEKATLGPLVQEKSLTSSYFQGPFPREFSRSLVGVMGWMQVELPPAVYWLYLSLVAGAGAGSLLWARGGRAPPARAVFGALFVLACGAGIVAYNLTYSQPQGRFLFPVLSLLAIAVSAGLRELARPLSWPPALAGAALCLVVALVAADVAALRTVVAFYGRPGLFP